MSPYLLVDGRRMATKAIEELRLEPGDTVVELGTGTGWNLTTLSGLVGPTGKVIAVDISPGMLDQARDRITTARLDNVELVQADIATYQLPPGTRAVVSTFAMEMLPGYDEVIAQLVYQLPAGGRIAVSGLRSPERWPDWVIRLGSAANRPFGVTNAYQDQSPWEAIEAHSTDTTYAEAFGGAAYVAAGSRPQVTHPQPD